MTERSELDEIKTVLENQKSVDKIYNIELRDQGGVIHVLIEKILSIAGKQINSRNMFTLKEIEEANSKVQSGADFPKLAQELIEMGVKSNDVYVSDGHAEYSGEHEYCVKSGANYPSLEVADQSDAGKFACYLKIHQQGQTDYPAFCRHSAETGVEKWTIDFDKMICTYYDKKGSVMLAEKIPSA